MRWVYPVLIFGAGCVDGFAGSNVQIDLSPATPVQVASGVTPGPTQLPADTHYRLYAIHESDEADRLFEVQRFQVRRIVDLQSPCFIDAGEHVPFPGLHVTQFRAKVAEVTGITDVSNPPPGASVEQVTDAATADQRMRNIAALGGQMGIKVVTPWSTASYPAADADCNGSGLPPPSCIDDAANARRLATCQQIWRDNPDLFEGTDRVLTAPLNGTTLGFVVGLNPINLAPVGGAQFFVEEALFGTDEYVIYIHEDDDDTDGEPGTLFLHGRPELATRGVHHVHLTSPTSPMISADMAVFENLGEDDVHF